LGGNGTNQMIYKALDAYYMAQAIKLSLKSQPYPSPRVGACLVRNGKIISVAHKTGSGEEHTEFKVLFKGAKKYIDERGNDKLSDMFGQLYQMCGRFPTEIIHRERNLRLNRLFPEILKEIDKRDGFFRQSTLYLTLEPCTYPGLGCSYLIISSGIPRVVIAATDNLNPRINGQGIKMLRESGIDVNISPFWEYISLFTNMAYSLKHLKGCFPSGS